jgi:hypothetical protein
MYHEVIKLGREVMIDQGLTDPSLPLEENPPGRGGVHQFFAGGLFDRSFTYRSLKIPAFPGKISACRYHEQRTG